VVAVAFSERRVSRGGEDITGNGVRNACDVKIKVGGIECPPAAHWLIARPAAMSNRRPIRKSAIAADLRLDAIELAAIANRAIPLTASPMP